MRARRRCDAYYVIASAALTHVHQSKGSPWVTQIKEYRVKIEKELADICEDILAVLDQHLIKSAESGESKVFYHKMCATCPSLR